MSGPRHYELCSILIPELSQKEMESFKSSVKQIIEEDGGKVGLFDVWGKRALAYNLKRFDWGLYVLVEFEGNGRLNEKLGRFLKTNDVVLRYLLVKKDRREEKMVRKRKGRLRGRPSLGDEDSKEIGITENEGEAMGMIEEGIVEKRETKGRSKRRRKTARKRFTRNPPTPGRKAEGSEQVKNE